MKDGLGSIRTDIQGQGAGAVAAAGERIDRLGCAGGWDRRRHLGALARGCTVQARGRAWTAAGRLEAVVTTAAMNEADKSAWCRSHGAYPEELAKWRASATTALAAPEELRASPQATRHDRKRIKELERELLRKDRALAETAALLVLSKKVQAIFNKGEDE
jgi:transposase